MKRSRGVSRRRKEERGGGSAMTAGVFTPDRKSTTLRWAFSGTGAASATYGENVFSGNGLFDPGLTATSSQPVGYDQYALWYNRYHVKASKITLEIQLYSTSATPTATATGARIVLYPSNTSAVASSVMEAMAQPRAVFHEVGSNVPAKFSMEMTSRKAVGFDGRNTDSTDSAGVGAQPTAQWYWHLGLISGGYTGMELLAVLHIDYQTEFYWRITQPLSLLEKLQKEMNLAVKEEIKKRENQSSVPFLIADDVKVDDQDVKVLPRLEVERTEGKSVSIDNAGLVPVPLVRQQKNERFVVLNTPSSLKKF